MLGRFSCHSRKRSQTIFATEITIKILAVSALMIDFVCKTWLRVIPAITGNLQLKPCLVFVNDS